MSREAVEEALGLLSASCGTCYSRSASGDGRQSTAGARPNALRYLPTTSHEALLDDNITDRRVVTQLHGRAYRGAPSGGRPGGGADAPTLCRDIRQAAPS